MTTAFSAGDLHTAVTQRLIPTITVLNRLEARPRTLKLDRALRAEVRDALWMLSKQWQMGEFRGSDAGSPVFAKLVMDTTRLTKYRPGDHPAEPLGYDVPLEATVERQAVPLRTAAGPLSLDIRLAMGRQWVKMIVDLPVGYRQAFINAYPVQAPNPAKDADRCAHPEVWQMFAAAAGRAMDGGLLYAHLLDATHHAYDGVVGIAPADHAELDARAIRFVAWLRRLFLHPTPDADAWQPDRLEYRFAASAPTPAGEKVYLAEEYAQGRLDWYSVDVDTRVAGLGPVAGAESTGLPPDEPRTMIPIPVSFVGMPNTRWWTFEEQQTNFGDIDAATTDLAKLLFLEFALVYSNDWFVIPYTLPAGAIATIRGFVVTTVFGERYWITAAGSGPDDAWQRWSLFTVNRRQDPSVRGGAAADTSLVLMPTVPKIQQGDPVEDVWLIRDEVANMVWGVERTIPLASGRSKPGAEAATQTYAFHRDRLATPSGATVSGGPPPPKAKVRYQVMTGVPENWIPFLPVHVPGDVREIQLQRAALPRIIEGEPPPPAKVQPRTGLLRQGLDDSPANVYFIHEEEVSRAGTRVLRTYQRTRWTDGRVYTWLGVQRQTGRGEGSSGLAFDQLRDTPRSG
jgi:hypothetical protein